MTGEVLPESNQSFISLAAYPIRWLHLTQLNRVSRLFDNLCSFSSYAFRSLSTNM